MAEAAWPCATETDLPHLDDARDAAALEQQIEDFLDRRGEGAVLLDALYGASLSELLPRRLSDMLPGWRGC
jgi:hypothetical protein